MYLAENKRKQLEVLKKLENDSLTYAERTALQDELIELENERTKLRLIKQKAKLIRKVTYKSDFYSLTLREIAEIRNQGLNNQDIANYFGITKGMIENQLKDCKSVIEFYYNPIKSKKNKTMLLDANV
ncbi:DUF2481 family protein [Listeria monocytogenes]|nr:DUF2481 domain-containing protein [Listeria monocytogenes]EAE1498763.1 DUF2481 domain-containing protein [Listeria monocytogenes]HDI3721979.1 DUF2481 family protein [Listeria monocytogenes]HDU3385678.1 DUF2481 family protein [Listeria monocytogenes]